jgi:tryptophan-rich sensory protein
MILNRTDAKGEAANALAALIAVLALNALVFGVGLERLGVDPAVWFEPPGWLVGLVWAAIFPMWGIARWHALRGGREGRGVARYILVMIGWSLLYPLLSAGSDLYKSVVLNAVSLLIVAVAFVRARKVSTSAANWIAPSLAWVVFANLLTLAKINNLDM